MKQNHKKSIAKTTGKSKAEKGKSTAVEVVKHKDVSRETVSETLTPTSQADFLIQHAIENNVPVDTMERLLAMRRELKAEYAKEQFDISMAVFQGECPIIQKTKDGATTSTGKVAYKYAPLDVIVGQTKELITKNGFSYGIKTKMEGEKVFVTCIVKHRAGHHEESSIEMEKGTKTGVMSASQVTAAALTFAKRYAFCNAFGILTGDEDTDGKDDTPNNTQTAPQPQNTQPQPPKNPPPPKPAQPIQTSTLSPVEQEKQSIGKLLKQKGLGASYLNEIGVTRTGWGALTLNDAQRISFDLQQKPDVDAKVESGYPT